MNADFSQFVNIVMLAQWGMFFQIWPVLFGAWVIKRSLFD